MTLRKKNQIIWETECDTREKGVQLFGKTNFALSPHQEILVAQLEGSQGLARDGATAVHEHRHRVHPVHLADIEDQLDRYARWEIKVHRPGL